MNRLAIFSACIVAQMLALCAIAEAHFFIIQTGKIITVHAKPVDPYDPFRGEYLALQYDFSDVPTSADIPRGTVRYTILKKNNSSWSFVKLQSDDLNLGPDEVGIKGEVEYCAPNYLPSVPLYNRHHAGYVKPPDRSAFTAHMRYGCEDLYMSEGKSNLIQHQNPNLSVELAVDRFGDSTIKRVLRDGKTIGGV